MTEKGRRIIDALAPHPTDDGTPPDRSPSIDPIHTFARGGRGDPNSGPDYNPVLEVFTSLPAAELRGEQVVREIRTE